MLNKSSETSPVFCALSTEAVEAFFDADLSNMALVTPIGVPLLHYCAWRGLLSHKIVQNLSGQIGMRHKYLEMVNKLQLQIDRFAEPKTLKEIISGLRWTSIH